MAFSLDDGEEEEVFARGFSRIVDRPAYGDHHLRLGANVPARMIKEKVFLEGAYNIFLKRYGKLDEEIPDEEMSSGEDV